MRTEEEVNGTSGETPQVPRRKTGAAEQLRDFTVSWHVLPISGVALLIGLGSSLLAWCLLKLIGLSTHLFYFGQFATSLVSPATHHLGAFAVFVPIAGGLMVGLLARYGSDRIRGHGMPEAIESILMNGSRVAPKLAVLKPVSAAIAIGSGGPFGAEGPIIMTGGAFGSLVAQLFHLTSAERKTLLVAGAAAGMSAVFAAPLSSVLLAVELLLFEWKPRSLVPVALASVAAAVSRYSLLGPGPLFRTPQLGGFPGVGPLVVCVGAGLLAGAAAALLSRSIYVVEDLFSRLPIHWMWWPAVGGAVVGLGGLIFPPALGVGYDVIGRLLLGSAPLTLIAGVLLVKSAIWCVSLGSGTSGGILAPLLMVGAALGSLIALVAPTPAPHFWPVVGMAAVLAGATEAPFAAIVFAMELTRDFNLAMPLTVSCFVAFGFMAVVMKRSILTEKIARRGYHVGREYSTDPLETFFVRDAMRPAAGSSRSWGKSSSPTVALPDETLKTVVYRMVETGVTVFPVVDALDRNKVVGVIELEDLLRARNRTLGEERDRERPLGVLRGLKRQA